jgi:hypothetical protein
MMIQKGILKRAVKGVRRGSMDDRVSKTYEISMMMCVERLR